MNRIAVGAVSALLLASAGFFWWQGRAELERGARRRIFGQRAIGD
jgi:hypothetical protein